MKSHHQARGARPARRAALAALVSVAVAAAGLGLLVSVAGGAAGASGARPRQEQESTTSRPEILVPGPTVQPTTTTEAPTTTTESSSRIGRWARDILGDETGRTVAVAIAGLLLVALVLALLTIRYWRRTRPLKVRVPAGSRRS